MTSAWRRAVPNQVFVGQPMIKQLGAVRQGDESSRVAFPVPGALLMPTKDGRRLVSNP